MNSRSTFTSVLLILVLPAIVFVEISYWQGWLPKASSGLEGDWGTYYSPGYLLRNGHADKMYDYAAQHQVEQQLINPNRGLNPYLHPPFEAWFFAAFTFMSYRTSFWVFMGLNFLLLIAAFILVARRLPAGGRSYAPIVALCFMPLSQAIVNGQDTIIVLFLLALAASLLDRQRESAAGALMGLCLFRFHVILPIALLFFCWRKWRFLGAFAIVGLLLVLISVLTMGPAGMRSYLSALLGSGILNSGMYRPVYIEDPHQMVSLRALVMSIATFLPPIAQKTIIVLGSAALFVWRAWNKPKPAPGAGGEALEWAVPVGVLLGYHVYGYEASLASLAMVPMLARRGSMQARIAWTSLIAPPLLLLRGAMFLFGILLLAISLSQRREAPEAVGMKAAEA